MKRRVLIFVFLIVFLLSCIPILGSRFSESRTNIPVFLFSQKMKEGQKVILVNNHPSESIYQNLSFEYITHSSDVFSGVDGYRPFPWGGELFMGNISFLSIPNGHKGRGFMIISNDKQNHGAIAVPDLPLKPNIQPGELYFLSFWVKYSVEEGQGFRLTQQFFRKEDEKYPYYACYGAWLTGNSNQRWEYIGLLVRAPNDSWKGDPVLELQGKGYVVVDDVYFGRVTIEGGEQNENP